MKTPNFNLDLIYVYQPMCNIAQDQLQFVDTPCTPNSPPLCYWKLCNCTGILTDRMNGETLTASKIILRAI